MNRLPHLLKRPGVLLRRLSTTARLLAVAGILALFAGGAAVAYWTTTGAGAASATAGTLDNVTIGDVTFDGALYPLSDPIAVHVPLMNPNSFAVDIDSIVGGTITSDKAGCSGATTGVTLDLSSINGTVAPGLHTYTASASMSAASVTECQGATFSAALNLVVHK